MRVFFLLILLFGLPSWGYGATANCSWVDNSSGSGQEDNFVLERGPGCSGPWTVIASPSQNAQTWTDMTAVAGSTYCYRIKAVNTVGPSTYNTSALFTVPGGGSLPGVPSGLTCSYSPTTPPPSGLVLALAMNGTGSATAVPDSSGLNNHGTRSGATWITTGKYGGALSFDGVNDWVTINDTASLDLTTGMTLEGWLYPTTTAANWRPWLAKEAGTETAYVMYANTTPAGTPNVGITVGGTETVLSGAALPLNTWTHIAATYDGAMLRFYRNGVQTHSVAKTGSILTSTGVLRIGGENIWTDFFQGRIDNVRMYNRALTQSEVATNMNTAITP